jgi:hypothetical protein
LATKGNNALEPHSPSAQGFVTVFSENVKVKPYEEDERKLRSSQQGRLEIPLRNNINTNSSFKEKSRERPLE